MCLITCNNLQASGPPSRDISPNNNEYLPSQRQQQRKVGSQSIRMSKNNYKTNTTNSQFKRKRCIKYSHRPDE